LEALPVTARLFCRGSYKYGGLRSDADFEIENRSDSIVGVKRLQCRGGEVHLVPPRPAHHALDVLTKCPQWVPAGVTGDVMKFLKVWGGSEFVLASTPDYDGATIPFREDLSIWELERRLRRAHNTSVPLRLK